MRRSESGFTVLELLVASAIAAIIGLGVFMTTVQIMQGSVSGNDRAVALRQAQNLGYWVNNDVMTARTIYVGDNITTGDEEFIITYWNDWETGDTHEMRYIYLESSDGLMKLKRNHVTHDRDGFETGNTMTFVADNIYSANLTATGSGWALNVETRSGANIATREYKIFQRFNE